MENKSITEAIARIVKTERLFDKLTEIVNKSPNKLNIPSVQEKIKKLSDYYTSGEWLNDYELDEQNLLPKELKRGVLSEDGLYNLLYEISEKTHGAPS